MGGTAPRSQPKRRGWFHIEAFDHGALLTGKKKQTRRREIDGIRDCYEVYCTCPRHYLRRVPPCEPSRRGNGEAQYEVDTAQLTPAKNGGLNSECSSLNERERGGHSASICPTMSNERIKDRTRRIATVARGGMMSQGALKYSRRVPRLRVVQLTPGRPRRSKAGRTPLSSEINVKQIDKHGRYERVMVMVMVMMVWV